MNFAVFAERKELQSFECEKLFKLSLQLLKRELEPETFTEIFVEGEIFDGFLVNF